MKNYDNWNDTDRLTGIEEREVTMKITFPALSKEMFRKFPSSTIYIRKVIWCTETQPPPACSNVISSNRLSLIFLVECIHGFKMKS